MKQDKACYPLAVPLRTFIIDKHNGNISAFAAANDMKRQQVQQCLNKGYYHVVNIEGVNMLVMAKREIKLP